MALEAPMAWPVRDLLAETGGSPAPNTARSASYSVLSPALVAVAWALTAAISSGPMPASARALRMQASIVGAKGRTG